MSFPLPASAVGPDAHRDRSRSGQPAERAARSSTAQSANRPGSAASHRTGIV
jgi:hypothetical protein